jgi:hypothetical protein
MQDHDGNQQRNPNDHPDITEDDYYGCPNCNGEGTLDETTYCTCELGQDMENQNRSEE